MDDDIDAFLAEEEEAELNEDMLCSMLDSEKENAESGDAKISDSDRNKASWQRPLVANPITGAQDLGATNITRQICLSSWMLLQIQSALL